MQFTVSRNVATIYRIDSHNKYVKKYFPTANAHYAEEKQRKTGSASTIK